MTPTYEGVTRWPLYKAPPTKEELAVVKDVKVGMTKQQVVDIAGQPATSITMVNARGTCSTYLISEKNKKPKHQEKISIKIQGIKKTKYLFFSV